MAGKIPPQFLNTKNSKRKQGHQGADGNDSSSSDGVSTPSFVKAQDKQAESSKGSLPSFARNGAPSARSNGKGSKFLERVNDAQSKSARDKSARSKALRARFSKLTPSAKGQGSTRSAE